MNAGHMRTIAAIAALVSLVLAGPSADAGKKKKKKGGAGGGAAAAVGAPACGIDFLPLAQGHQWTYKFFVPENSTPPAGQLHIPDPESVTIQVVKVEAQGESTRVTLSESYRKVTVETVLTCDKDRLLIPPDSFFFAGEPGGSYGLEFDKLERIKGTSITLTNGSIGDQPWREDITAHWNRKPSGNSGANLGSGTLALERQYTPQQPEVVATKLGSWKSEKLALITTGRVTLDSKETATLKPLEIPEGWLSTIWMAENVGVVQTLNGFAHMYQLTDAKLK